MIRGITKTEGSITVFHLKDNLDTHHVKAFVRKIHDLMESGRIFLILDLSQVQEVCLLGMVSISNIFNKCRQQGGSLKISGLTTEVRECFEETNLINTIEIQENVLEAIKSFRSTNLLKAKNLSGSFYIEEENSFVPWDRLQARNYN